ncbi:polysaccharide pyruvyl transferase family protein [Thermomonospora echinospora]|uniref:polysaccharide pyruvyl transferase family protein n=1 Tax=Thermomonospora echinospora TaxID=1992 RepID=UPI001F27196D|nr:polysaccharide pyruvyl transferase family protein [Thermomonospora echinospora]
MRVGVAGSYGGLNLGDEAILMCVLACLRQLRPSIEFTVFSRNAEHTRRMHGLARVVGWEGADRRQVQPSLQDLDLLVLGGGGLLHDGAARGFLRLVRLAQKSGIPTFGYALGAGPLTEAEDRRLVREAVHALNDLTVRDQESKLVLEEVEVDREIDVAADPALLLTPEPFTREMLEREGIPRDGHLVAMSVREPGRAAQNLDEHSYHELLGEVADFLVHRLDANVVFVPMERDDISHAHAVLSHMVAADRGHVLKRFYEPGQIAGLMRHFDLAVGMRLHFVMLAACAGVPVMPLPYAGKVFDFARIVGAPTLTGVARREAGPLIAEIDRLWDEREHCARLLRDRIAQLKRQAAVSCRRCGELIEQIEESRAALPVRGVPGTSLPS